MLPPERGFSDNSQEWRPPSLSFVDKFCDSVKATEYEGRFLLSLHINGLKPGLEKTRILTQITFSCCFALLRRTSLLPKHQLLVISLCVTKSTPHSWLKPINTLHSYLNLKHTCKLKSPPLYRRVRGFTLVLVTLRYFEKFRLSLIDGLLLPSTK